MLSHLISDKERSHVIHKWKGLCRLLILLHLICFLSLCIYWYLEARDPWNNPVVGLSIGFLCMCHCQSSLDPLEPSSMHWFLVCLFLFISYQSNKKLLQETYTDWKLVDLFDEAILARKGTNLNSMKLLNDLCLEAVVSFMVMISVRNLPFISSLKKCNKIEDITWF